MRRRGTCPPKLSPYQSLWRHAGRRRRGFTLIETLIYLGLFAIIIGGVMVTVYYVIQSGNQTVSQAVVQGEADFLLRKIDWILSGVDAINSPGVGSSSSMLSVDKVGYPSNPITVDSAGEGVRLSKGGGAPERLSSSAVTVGNLQFLRAVVPAGKPAAVLVSFTVNGKVFSMTRYLRK